MPPTSSHEETKNSFAIQQSTADMGAATPPSVTEAGQANPAPETASTGTGHGFASNFPQLRRATTAGGHAVDTSQPAFPVYHRKIGNPTPLGLMAFAGTTWVLSLFNCGARGVSHPELVVALCVATGGMAQFMAGVWEFAVGNTFGAAVFCMYGSFWWSYACIYIPWFGIQAAVPADELPNAIGVYLSAWVIITFIFLCSCLRSSVALVSTVFFLWLTFVLLMAAEMSGNSHVQTAGGAIGIVTAVCAFYTAACGLCDGTTSLFKLPTGDLTRSD